MLQSLADQRRNPARKGSPIRRSSAVQSVHNPAHNPHRFPALKTYNRRQWNQPQTMRSMNRFQPQCRS
jgi:hypothetical protein